MFVHRDIAPVEAAPQHLDRRLESLMNVGLIDGSFRQGLEETEMGYGLEVDMIDAASQMGLLTCPYVFNPEEAVAMAKAGGQPR